MEDTPGRRRRGLHLSLALVLSLAAGVRTASYIELRGGPLLYMHHWTESDMHFFRDWARGIAAGDYLSVDSGKPAHSWHDNFAREVHEMTGSTEPYGPDYRRRLWDRWLGAPRFYQDPLYPYLLAAEIGTIGDRPAAVVAAQMLLGVASAGLAWFIALELFGPGAALAAGLLAALFGPSLLFEVLLLRTSAITFLGLAVTAAALLALREGASRGWLVAAGALSGLSVLLKSSALLVTGALLAIVIWRHR
ncbi:MAG TPA: glycosyltransferase family 39 protein, partial [Candidatus Saccharimonadales bacterium]|nr:glycosyltransferase family 39 protein [Candidatus Saccharimonadales bacterium]